MEATTFVSSKKSHLLKGIVTLVHLQECDVAFSLFFFMAPAEMHHPYLFHRFFFFFTIAPASVFYNLVHEAKRVVKGGR